MYRWEGDITFFVLSWPPPPSSSPRTSTPSSSPQPANPILALSEKFYSGYYASPSRPEDSTLSLSFLPVQPSRPPPHCFSLYSHFVSFLPYLRSSGYIYIYSSHPLSSNAFLAPFSGGREGGGHNIITISKSRFLMSSCKGDVMHLQSSLFDVLRFPLRRRRREEKEEIERERVLVGG